MAESSPQSEYLNICRLQELFKGRFSVDEVGVLLEICNGDIEETVDYILNAESFELRRRLDEAKWTKIETVKRERPDVIAQARRGLIDTTPRMFTCVACDSIWWRRTPSRKQVSKCKRCNTKYDPLPREEEWGWAQFDCNCGNQFSGHCGMWQSSPCYQCKADVKPTRILPPNKERNRQSESTHCCNAPNCSGIRAAATRTPRRQSSPVPRRRGADIKLRDQSTQTQPKMTHSEEMCAVFRPGAPWGPPAQTQGVRWQYQPLVVYRQVHAGNTATSSPRPDPHSAATRMYGQQPQQPSAMQRSTPRRAPAPSDGCLHPRSLRARGYGIVVNASEVHDSTGSTVATFLPQEDLEMPREYICRPLDGIEEDSSNEASFGDD